MGDTDIATELNDIQLDKYVMLLWYACIMMRFERYLIKWIRNILEWKELRFAHKIIIVNDEKNKSVT